MQPLADISVIIPLYNKQDYILAAMQSLCQNSVLPREVVIVDDCSSDRSMQVATEFIHTYSGPVRFVLVQQERNQGPVAARLRAIKESTSGYIAFLDADDAWHPEFVQSVSAVLEPGDVDLLAVAFYSTRLQKQIFNARDFSQYCKQQQPGVWQVLYLESVLCKNFILGGGNVIARRALFEGLQVEAADRIFEDWCVWLTLIASVPRPLNIWFLDRALYIYNDDVGQSLSNSRLALSWSATEPSVLRAARRAGFDRLERMVYWCWITNSARRIPGLIQRLRFFVATGAGRGRACRSRYLISGLMCVVLGDSVIRLSNYFRRKKNRG